MALLIKRKYIKWEGMLYKSILISMIMGCYIFSGCNGKEEKKAQVAEKNVAILKSTNESDAQLTRQQLAGKWCYAFYEAGYGDDKEREEENITYIFKEDGLLLYQANPRTPVEKEGSYQLENGELKIEPTLTFLPAKILFASENKFVLGNSTTQLVFTRGACGE